MLNRIVVKSQAEYDEVKNRDSVEIEATDLNLDVDGVAPILLKGFYFVTVCGDATVHAWGYGQVRAIGGAPSIKAEDSVVVKASDRAKVVVRGFKNCVFAYQNAEVIIDTSEVHSINMHGESILTCSAHTRVNGSIHLYEKSIAEVRGSCTIDVNGNAKLDIYGDAVVYAYSFSRVVAQDDVVVYAKEHAHVVASGNVLVTAQDNVELKLSEFVLARIRSDRVRVEREGHHGEVLRPEYEVKEDFIAYKKGVTADNKEEVIITLEIPKGSKFQCAIGRKCRGERAKVVRIEDREGNRRRVALSLHDRSFKYRVGQVVEAEYNTFLRSCGSGVHFFLTEEEASTYSY